MYEVVKTLEVDGQRDRKACKDDEICCETKHTEPIGYVLEDLRTGDLFAVNREEAILKVLDQGSNNAIISRKLKTDKKTGKKVQSAYIRSRSGCKDLQDPSMIMLFDKNLLIRNGVDISDGLIWVLRNYTRLKNAGLL